ncbi:hypothetical protein [Nocardioides sp. AX2bis]|uniref:hypothetical protein n=1 Tax=Nocardioides sp. AX2bis TaxID=2653157 RepID=UPI0012EFDB1F|nr:hypothetical protein [Nocardioides sp. AX2bis]VXC29382.1 conserved hypothetical protein [Nocardioides sp. AX2bis]
MTWGIEEALRPVLDDLQAAEGWIPPVDPTPWQDWQPSESCTLVAYGSSAGVWLDMSLDPASGLARLADQVQDWVVEQLPGMHRPAVWPTCPAHPDSHPRQAVVEGGRAVWACPRGAAVSTPIGRLGEAPPG